eukprot:TRINITY_DN506_c0_g1_i4.p4 TRINITY_DN506_c0_g1~~TRINITY_DN506_c0_g1_i4.p4  ORF type:complete len:117 (-),score=18.55 TRINITY_DN506_c0_g1_i4:851-1159(-)
MCIRDRACGFFFFQAEDGIRDRSPSRGLGDVYKRQLLYRKLNQNDKDLMNVFFSEQPIKKKQLYNLYQAPTDAYVVFEHVPFNMFTSDQINNNHYVILLPQE